MMDPTDEPTYSMREHQLWPLMHLILGLLRHCRYWERTGRAEICKLLEYYRTPVFMYQFRQTDGVSCGIFSAIQANRLISSKTFNFDPTQDDLDKYQKLLAVRIFGHCQRIA
ncbi:hypothetical protein C2S52_011513 [Perilla frutescens var. hirtella]|nr:hypothetical protein C2S52_011513 [Perilla frutescens var. hirtella]